MMENILISPDSLAASAGASGQTDPDASPASDSENGIRNVKLQLGILQRRPRREQERTYSELSAKYLPALVARFKGCSDPLNASMTLINAVSHTPYFVRFLRTDAGRGLAALQATRMASLEADDARPEQTAEMCQFLATLLLLQGTSDIEDADKRKLVMKLQLWKRKHNSSYASETSERCLGILTNDPHMQDMLNMVKRMSTKGVEECGAQGCGRRQMATGPDLLQCSRCKTAVYCGKEHQRQAWSSHKPVCFSPAF
ncbi:hypothetical protein GLOTRDRAFT_116208 [Gloeophyllum trabeum ATCC 11539]|uniref:MYND-type domain-containing protein n=1 Tax=Gloeophyllum trabeum (strain ATCC 11539 / FP-39264 / Madison 617) TaxID=670483 RepID=S7Q5B4_GLOTA|nr:uncharacterized protein GLOTRDRAFT_116208 [Gloeophyllum trabeum ATCC 11539]EPQ55231.1 hypothetical protein GLOTRDRAFT_116208 [Gloeophyllum trabeum ATCC 11539]